MCHGRASRYDIIAAMGCNADKGCAGSCGGSEGGSEKCGDKCKCKKQCVCEHLVMVNRGCQCGAVKAAKECKEKGECNDCT